MDVRYINPFVVAAANAFKVMAGWDAARGAPVVRGSLYNQADLSGIIDLAGRARGVVLLSLPGRLAKDVFEKMTGLIAEEGDPGIPDAVGELANVIVGGAKAGLTELGLDFQLSVPTVLAGKGQVMASPDGAPCLIIPFQVDGDTLWLQFALTASPE